MKQQQPLVTFVSYCSLEKEYGSAVISNARQFSDLVVVSMGTRLYSGEPEDVEGERSRLVSGAYSDAVSSLCPVHVVTYEVNDTLRRTPIVLHNLAREVGLKAARAALGARTPFWCLLLDGDEIPEGSRVREWWQSPAGDALRSDTRAVHKLANRWMFLHPRLVAETLEDSVLLVHSDALSNPESLRHPRERDGIYLWHLTMDGWHDLRVERRVLPPDGQPLFWHFSWVRPSQPGPDGTPDGGRAALKAKCANWGHRDDGDWGALIDNAFDRIAAGCWPSRDFVHGYPLKLLDRVPVEGLGLDTTHHPPPIEEEAYSLDQVRDVDLSAMYKYARWNSNLQYFQSPRGEHYKLLSHLASQVPPGSTAIDIGTYYGYSALALATNPDLKVITYDIVDLLPTNVPTARDLPNIQRRIGDCMKDVAVPGFLDKVKIIVLDVDPHDGVQERVMIDGIIEAGYTGIMVMDDIGLNEDMKGLWKWATSKPGMISKDVTEIGHWSGTGMLDFSQLKI